jgi:hypothetical protein
MPGHHWTGFAHPEGQRPAPAHEQLDRALVAGLMLEVSLHLPAFQAEPQVRRQFFKARLKDSLIFHLAGQVTLDRFRDLTRRLDHWFTFYYPLVCGSGGAGAPEAPSGIRPSGDQASRLKEDAWRDFFNQNPGLLPRRRHRKITCQGLQEFLGRSRGAWFSLKEFGEYFAIGRKTAWEYLQKFQHAGLLVHNGARSVGVRYSLAPQFLAPAPSNLRL